MLSPRHLTIPAGALAFATLGFVAACSDSTANAGAPLSLSVTTRPQTPSSQQPAAVASTLLLSKAQVVIRQIELKSADDPKCEDSEIEDHSGSGSSGGSGGDDAEHEDECDEVEIGPFLFDLPLDGTTKTDFTPLVTPGTFREIEVKIGPVRSGNSGALSFLTQHPELKDISVRVEGTLDGKAFTFQAAVDAEFEKEFEPPITIALGSTANVTVAIDVKSWFSDGAGGTLDPANPANAARIAENIKRSLRAFRDDDCDGEEDHDH
jgi:carbon monoxide dehydrogenase subunit G